jgi:oleate hydratase
MHAVYTLLTVDRHIPPIYHGLLNTKVTINAVHAALK